MNKSTEQIYRIVILGAGYAGMLAALRLAGKRRKLPVQITLVNGSASFVERIRLHQRATNQRLPQISIPRLLRGTGVHFVQGWVTELQPTGQRVKVQREDGELILSYHSLIYALGSTVDLTSVPGVAQHATALGSTAMVDAIRDSIPALAAVGGRVLVVGSGLTGLEAATEFAEQYPTLDVHLITRGKVGEELSQKGRRHVASTLERLGIHVRENVLVRQVQPQRVVDAAGGSYPFDLCLWSAGFTVSQLAADAQIATDSKGRIMVDANLTSTSHPNIYAIGDAAHTPLRMACATAMPMGAFVGEQLAKQLTADFANSAGVATAPTETARESTPFEFAYAMRCVSLGRRNGLIQMVDGVDRTQERIVTGRLASLVKELICRYPLWMIRAERRWPGIYQWLRAPLTRHEQHHSQSSTFSA